jgi:hypothetical protein
LNTANIHLSLPFNTTYPSKREITKALLHCKSNAERERLKRKERMLEMANGNGLIELNITISKIGQIIFVGLPAEAYSEMQIKLRQAFPDCIIIVMNNCNGSSGYLIPQHYYQRTSFYPAWQTPYREGAFELVFEQCFSTIHKMCQS